MKCPYYRKISVEHDPYGLKAYCEGDPRKGLRVPSLFEETHYCRTLHYPACRVFQARQAYGEDEDVPEPSQAR
jgi:hypothetical protein